MLVELLIKNFAIIENVSINFGKGLNIISGETGAGKSIIINAVNLLLGGRANSEIIRTGENEATVEAFFDIDKNKKLKNLLQSHGFLNDELIIKRTISKNGKNKIYINGSMSSLAILQTITSDLIEIAAQHENQTLQNPENHINLLDYFGKFDGDISTYKEKLFDLKKIIADITTLEASCNDQKLKLDYISYQLNEINTANLRPEEDLELEEKRKWLINFTRIQEAATSSYKDLYEGENSVIEKLMTARNNLEKLSKLDPSAQKFFKQSDQAYIELEDLSLTLRDYTNKIDNSDDNIDFIEERLAKINQLKKKYGKTIKDILEKRTLLEKEINIFENFDHHIQELKEAAQKKLILVYSLAKDLSSKRHAISKVLTEKLHAELKELAMNKTKILIDIKPLSTEPISINQIDLKNPPFGELGIDKVEFLCSTNIGEEPKPLAKIASGGELSRFILSFKNVLSSKDNTSIYIFDEVDSGVSGAQAEIVGRKIKSVSKSSQVLCITHLPQIASQADIHFNIYKQEAKGRTFVKVKTLNKSDRIEEISRMIAGVNVTKSAVDHARHLVENAI